MAKDTILRIRVDRDTLHRILVQARDTQTTASAVIRAAIDAYLVRDP
jgi:hypothetical protein